MNRYAVVSTARAARIAAAYASFYLEQGEDGKPELKGRFYWMGLAAFASKQRSHLLIQNETDYIGREMRAISIWANAR